MYCRNTYFTCCSFIIINICVIMFFRRKREKVVIEVLSKFRIDDFVDFYYRDDIYFGKVSKIYFDASDKIYYDIDIAGQCPATLTGIEEEKIIRIHERK